MWVRNLRIENIKGFKSSGNIGFSKSLNILIGPNNSGKSTILQAIYFLQGSQLNQTDVRKKAGTGLIEIEFDGNNFERFSITNPDKKISKTNNINCFTPIFHIEINAQGNITKQILKHDKNYSNYNDFHSVEPSNLIYPFLSKRKVGGYSESVGLQYARQVGGTLNHLTSKIDRLSDPNFPKHEEYKDACVNILGYPISATQSEGGKRIGLIVDIFNTIPIEAMGEGVPNILALIADLCLAENQIFLIEELENDIHPKALKGLLNLMMTKSDNNQFFISTHSNIVTKILGSVDSSKIFNVSMSFENVEARIPESSINELRDDAEERRKALEELGYDFVDFDLWSGWLFLEESSAEVLIREYFIKWFVPELIGKLRTFSTGGKDEMIPKFEDFNRMFVYLHLTKVYKNKAWVVIDSGEEEAKIIDKLKTYYLKDGWEENRFKQFSKQDFENFYPENFIEKVKAIKAMNKCDKRSAKKTLLDNVIAWIKDDEERAKEKFSVSAIMMSPIFRTDNLQK